MFLKSCDLISEINCIYFKGSKIHKSIIGGFLTIIGLILLVLFGYFELHQRMPAFEFHLFKNRSFTAYNIAGLCGYLAVMVLTTIFNYHFQYVRGWDPEHTGLILLISPVVMSITAQMLENFQIKYIHKK